MEVDGTLIGRLRKAADEIGERLFLRMDDGAFSYGQAFDLVARVASGLESLGIRRGDRVGIIADNCPEAVWSWLGSNAAGAIDVPFNPKARGGFLAYLVADATPRVIIGTEEHLQTLAQAVETAPEWVVSVDGDGSDRAFGAKARHLSFGELLDRGSARHVADVGPGDVATIMYTSGTTGPSKGVMIPHGTYVVGASRHARIIGMGAGETAYCAVSLAHMDARACIGLALDAGGASALARRFSVRGFWDDVRGFEANVFFYVGTMLWLLYKAPASPGDDDHPARIGVGSAAPPEIHRAFEQRFGVELLEGYGMTEMPYIVNSLRGSGRPGGVGVPIPEAEVQLVDDHEVPVAPGEVGELCLRPRVPSYMTQGYWQKESETVEAWRNLWFHTGDFLRVASDGQFEYVGRKNDAIRHRGENVSAWEVEQAVTAHPDVLEAAAIGVPSSLGEEDVAVLAVLRPEAELEPAALREFAAPDLPRFAVPRYIEFVDAFPKTPSERIEKRKVRERGISATAWDAEAETEGRESG